MKKPALCCGKTYKKMFQYLYLQVPKTMQTIAYQKIQIKKSELKKAKMPI